MSAFFLKEKGDGPRTARKVLNKHQNLADSASIHFEMLFRFLTRPICFTLIATFAFSLLLFSYTALPAEQIPVLHTEGTFHGYLVVRTTDGKLIGEGDLIEVTKGTRISSRLIFRLRDGSIDDDRTVYDQHRNFSLVSDHHIQKGPSFAKPMDVSIDVPTGTVTIRSDDSGKEKVETQHMDLPPDLVNGFTFTILKNISPHTSQTTVSYLAGGSKPRVVRVNITPEGEDGFSVVGARYKAVCYRLKTELGGIAGMVAPLIGKEPQDTRIWVDSGEAPAFVKFEGPFAQGGPLWTIQLSSPEWPSSGRSEKASEAAQR